MALLNRIRYYSPNGDFPYEISLVFANQVAYETWVANNLLINNVTLLDSTAVDEVAGMSVITVGENEPITITGISDVVEEAPQATVVEETPAPVEAPVTTVEESTTQAATVVVEEDTNATEAVVEPVEATPEVEEPKEEKVE